MSDPISEIDRLLLAGTNREEEAIEAMVAAYRIRLTRLAESILNDSQEADDAIQQVFISAAARLDSYQPGSDFSAWIYTITINTCRGALRRRKARQALLRLIGRTQAFDQPLTHPEAVLLKNEASRRLWEAVDRLEDKQRLVVLLRYQEELPVHTIARILSVPEATVYTRLYSAFRKLRNDLSSPVEIRSFQVGKSEWGGATLKGQDP